MSNDEVSTGATPVQVLYEQSERYENAVGGGSRVPNGCRANAFEYLFVVLLKFQHLNYWQ